MKKLGLFLISIVTAGAVYAAGFTMPTQYTATMVATGGGHSTTMKEYVDGTKVRMETSAGGQNVISIVRPDKKVMYTVMVAQKMYMEMPYNPASAPAPVATGPGATLAKVGTETVEGKSCDKMSVTVSGKVSAYYWVDQKTNLPVKYASADGKSTMVYKDFKAGAPAASMFDPPSGYKKMAVGGH